MGRWSMTFLWVRNFGAAKLVGCVFGCPRWFVYVWAMIFCVLFLLCGDGFVRSSNFIVYCFLHLQLMAVGILESKSLKKLICRAHKLEWCLSEMCQDVFHRTAYIILSFYVAQWPMILNFILTHFWTAWIRYVIIATGMMKFCIARATRSGACKLQLCQVIRRIQKIIPLL